VSGCIHTPEGRAHFGVPLSKDKIQSRYERPVDQIFTAAKDVLRFNGTLTSENTLSKTIEARIDNNTVWVRVEEVEPNVSRVVTQARKRTGLGNLELASEIDKQIALQLQAR
jgi:ribosome-binding protein aMBF1 (putative translation factor)